MTNTDRHEADGTRCDYVPYLSSAKHRCPNEALVRIVRSHGGGVEPVYGDRCLHHASRELGPRVIAYREVEGGGWRATD